MADRAVGIRLAHAFCVELMELALALLNGLLAVRKCARITICGFRPVFALDANSIRGVAVLAESVSALELPELGLTRDLRAALLTRSWLAL
jgi:hypothetical protein